MMRRWMSLLVLLTWLLPLPAWAVIAERAGVKTSHQTSGATTSAKAAAGAVSIGDLIVACGSTWEGSTTTLSGVTDNLGTPTVYTVANDANTVGYASFIAYGIATAAGTPTITLTAAASGTYFSWGLDAFSGVHATPLDVASAAATGNDTTATMSITTNTAGALIIGANSVTNTLASWTPGSGYTEIFQDLSNSIAPGGCEFRVVTTATGYTVDVALGTSTPWQIQSMAFKPAGGAAAPIRHRAIQ